MAVDEASFNTEIFSTSSGLMLKRVCSTPSTIINGELFPELFPLKVVIPLILIVAEDLPGSPPLSSTVNPGACP